MKNWKLGAFFVISLMLIAGLFTNTVSAQSATFTVEPTMAYTDDIVDVKITYTVDADIEGSNTITIGLPTAGGWAARYQPSTNDMDGLGTGSVGFGNLLDELPSKPSAVTSLTDTAFLNLRSYAVLETNVAATTILPADLVGRSVSGGSVSIAVGAAGMKKADTISVTFYNVTVQSSPTAAGSPVSLDVRHTASPVATVTAANIQVVQFSVVTGVEGEVTVRPKDVTAETIRDLEITYRATSPLAVSAKGATEAEDGQSSYGRIQITLPATWGPSGNRTWSYNGHASLGAVSATTGSIIHPKLQPNDPDATYLEIERKSSSVRLAEGNDADENPVGLIPQRGTVAGDPWIIWVDVDKMGTGQFVTLVVKNLAIPKLPTDRDSMFRDIGPRSGMEAEQVKVESNHYVLMNRDDTFAGVGPKVPDPKVESESTTQPTIKVTRKKLGAVTISPNEVTAGSEQDFEITYDASEALVTDMNDDEVIDNPIAIEVGLPAGWAEPMPYGINATDKPDDAKGPHVYLSGSVSRLEDSKIDILGSELQGWFVRIVLGPKGLSSNGSIVLAYNEVTVQERLTTANAPAKIVVFSGPVVDNDNDGTPDVGSLPQFPVEKQEEDTIKVILAASGSGKVTFEFGGEDVTSSEKPNPNTDASIPAGLVADDGRNLIVTYDPDGDMGEGKFEIQMPTGWSAESISVSGEESVTPAEGSAVGSRGEVTVMLPEHFGQAPAYDIEIIFEGITVPNVYGDQKFTVKTKNEEKRFAPLAKTAMAFVGNAMADDDTVTVNITPKAAYEGETGVDFEIELTATGPMHDGMVEITVPDVFGVLQLDPDEPNYVKESLSRGAKLVISDSEEEITITTGDLDAEETIKFRIEDVDIPDDITRSEHFSVRTKTRGDELDLSDVSYVIIDADDNITGGAIRTIKGSGTMAVDPANVEQGSRNRDFDLIFTATANFEEKNLVITAPGVIDTDLQEGDPSGDGYVSTSDSAKLHEDDPKNDLIITGGNQIKWGMLSLNRNQTFTTTIEDVDLLEETGPAQWIVTLDGRDILLDDKDANPPMVVVGTTEDDVVFEIIEDGSTVFDPYYHAASEHNSIQFRFETANTTIQEGGTLRFRLPSLWTRPGVLGKEGTTEATVAIVTDDGLVTQIPSEDEDEDNAGEEMVLTTSRRDVILTIGEKGELDADSDPIIIQYGTKEHPVTISARAEGTTDSDTDGLAIRGHFLVSGEFRPRDAGTIFVDVINVEDGSGEAMFDPTPRTVRAGSKGNLIAVTYTGAGTMDGGAVRLTIPDGWGEMQVDDPLDFNHIEVEVTGSGAELDGDPDVIDDGQSVDANLKTFAKGDKVTFTYGGGRGTRESNGALAQAEIGSAAFIIESDGGSDASDFVNIRVDNEEDTEDDTEDPLTIEVKGAAGGSGEVVSEIEGTSAGAGLYDGKTDVDEEIMQVHAGDESTYIVFTYTATQTIADGKLRFTVAPGWSPPQDDSTGDPGYTYLNEKAGATISNEDYEAVPGSVIADISLDIGDSVEIHYGAEEGGAAAPDVVPAGGYSLFAIAIKGTADTADAEDYVDDEDLEIKVRVQRSGGGTATVDPMTVTAGAIDQVFTITYTADGQVDNGQLKLTSPSADWPVPAKSNVMVTGGGSAATPRHSGDYTPAELTALATAAAATADDELVLGAMDVIVDNVALAAGESVVFTYTVAVVQGTTGDADFAVVFNGGGGPGTAPIAVEESMTTVTVEEAGPGSGTIAVDTDGIILAGDTDRALKFTYTVAGEASYPADVRIAVPDGWDAPIASNYEVSFQRAGQTDSRKVEQKATQVPGSMVARVSRGETLMGGDLIIFKYTSTTTPDEPETSPFVVEFDGGAVTEGNSDVLVQAAEASMLDIDAPTKVSADMDAAPAKITIMIQDADGGEAAVAEDVTVGLSSTSSTGSFSETDGGAAVDEVTIPAGMSSKMVYYSDSRVGTAVLTVSADINGVLAHDTEVIVVSTDVLTINSVSFMISDGKDAAMDGDTITVTADIAGAPSKMPTFTIGTIVPISGGGSDMMDADGDGTYTGSHTLASGSAEGSHNVIVHVAGAEPETMMAEDMLVVDNTMPLVTITAPAADMTVANGESVTITATVSETSTVMADVSALDSTQTDVALRMGADGSYSVDVLISKENTHANGSKTITVTAMDAAGNSSPMVERMVMLDSMLSFTSMIPAGQTVLFHVPLDDDDVSTVGDLKEMLGDAVNLAIIWNAAESRWDSNTDDLVITADLGLILSMNAEATVTFKGDAWGNGASQIELKAGRNIIGLPLKDAGVTKVSDLLTALGVDSVTVSTNGGFVAVAAAGDPGGDDPVMGDAAYMVTSAADNTVLVLGSGWSNGGAASAAPIALAGYNVDNQTPVLDVRGSVVDEITGLAREGFRVKVKNLSTKAALSSVPSAEAADGYNMTFVDLTDAHAARVGDVLEISANSPDPLVGVKPVRHIVTIDDVKSNRIQLENLIAYEIPAETELLRNYPNPFNPETWIPYHLAEDTDVSLTIYETTGRLVRTIDVGHQTAAKYDTRSKAIYWDGRNQFGEQVASGLYFYSLSAGDFSATRRMVILK